MTPHENRTSAHKLPKSHKYSSTVEVDSATDVWENAWNVARSIRSDKSLDPNFDLRAETRRYYDRLKLTEDFDLFALAVEHAIHTVRVSVGESPMRDAIRTSFRSPIDHPCPFTRRLAGCCRYLSEKYGGKPFPLSNAKAAELLGFKSNTPTNRGHGRRATQRLVRLNVIELHEKGTNKAAGPSGKASTYRYLLPTPDAATLRLAGAS